MRLDSKSRNYTTVDPCDLKLIGEDKKVEIEGKNKTSDLTKVLINKAHGGRKQDSKFWKSEFDNKQTKKKSTKTRESNLKNFIGSKAITVILLSCTLGIYYFNGDKVKDIYGTFRGKKNIEIRQNEKKERVVAVNKIEKNEFKKDT